MILSWKKSSPRSNIIYELADLVISTGHNIKWDHFEIITTGKSDLQCKIKETLLISELKPSLNENVNSEKLCLYQFLPVVSILSLFFILSPVPLFIFVFLNVYNRSLLKMYVVAYETSSKPENFY